MTETKYAWAAGILEGEGCFSIFQRKERRNTKTTAIHCEMADRDVILRLQDVFGVGTIKFRDKSPQRDSGKKRKDTWVWSVQNKAHTFEVLLRVLPYLGERRRIKAQELMAHIEEVGYESR